MEGETRVQRCSFDAGPDAENVKRSQVSTQGRGAGNDSRFYRRWRRLWKMICVGTQRTSAAALASQRQQALGCITPCTKLLLLLISLVQRLSLKRAQVTQRSMQL